MSENEAQGGDPDTQSILDELEKETGAPSTEGSGPGDTSEIDGSARPDPAHSDQAEKFIEVAGQRFKTQEDLVRWAERLFNRNAQQGREHSATLKRYERAIKFQERLEKEPEYLQALTKAEAEYDRAKAGGATNAQAQKAALDTLPPEVKATIEKVDRYEKREQEREAKADADRTVKERADFEKAHPELKPDKIDKVVERMLYHGEKYGVELSYEDALLEVEVDELRAQNKAKSDQLRKVKADSDIGPGQGSPHAARKRDLLKEGSEEEFRDGLLSELEAGGHISSQ